MPPSAKLSPTTNTSLNKLARAVCVRCRGTKCPLLTAFFGPSGVHALPLAAGINEGGHYFRYFFPLVVFFSFLLFSFILLMLPPLFKTTEGVVVLFQIFAWAPKKK